MALGASVTGRVSELQSNDVFRSLPFQRAPASSAAQDKQDHKRLGRRAAEAVFIVAIGTAETDALIPTEAKASLKNAFAQA
jgi:hypothetical protein